jgi:prolyl oligopeptidase PreP (S9A serine peptidase family)
MIRVFKIDLSLWVDNITEAELRELVEEELNKACSMLEDQTSHESISYKIKEVIDCD